MKKFAVVLWGSHQGNPPATLEWFDAERIAWEWAALQRNRTLVTRIVVFETRGEVSTVGREPLT